MNGLSKFMKQNSLKNEVTSGNKIVEVAQKLNLKNFNIYIRTDKNYI